MKPFRIYADTSVIGGCFDAPFATESLRLIGAVRKGRLVLLLSEIVLAELEDAPQRVRDVLTSLPPASVEKVEITEEVLALRDAYLAAEILGPRGRMTRRTWLRPQCRGLMRLCRGISNTLCGWIK